MKHKSSDLETVFKRCFEGSERTRLLGGAEEPFYEPAGMDGGYHRLWYREDFFASALHETAHWCIAGEQRRKLRDFGYWYAPEGRSPEQQQAFLAVEAAPQALEWIFSLACCFPFRLSFDNVDGADDSGGFARRVYEHARAFQRDGVGCRAALFFESLSQFYGTATELEALKLQAEDLR